MNVGLWFGSILPTFVSEVARGGEGRKGLWHCPVKHLGRSAILDAAT